MMAQRSALKVIVQDNPVVSRRPQGIDLITDNERTIKDNENRIFNESDETKNPGQNHLGVGVNHVINHQSHKEKYSTDCELQM